MSNEPRRPTAAGRVWGVVGPGGSLPAQTSRTAQPAEPARLILCEPAGRWATRLRRELGDAVRIHETRSVAEAWQALAAAPASFVVVELTAAGREGLVRRMLRLPREFPLARVAVVAAPPLAIYETMIRQAGAVHFTCSGRRLGPLAEAIARHLAAVPQSPTGLAEQIWAALPWAIAR